MFVFTRHPVLTPGSMPGMFYRPSTVFAGWMNESDEAQRRQEEKNLLKQDCLHMHKIPLKKHLRNR